MYLGKNFKLILKTSFKAAKCGHEIHSILIIIKTLNWHLQKLIR